MGHAQLRQCKVNIFRLLVGGADIVNEVAKILILKQEVAITQLHSEGIIDYLD